MFPHNLAQDLWISFLELFYTFPMTNQYGIHAAKNIGRWEQLISENNFDVKK